MNTSSNRRSNSLYGLPSMLYGRVSTQVQKLDGYSLLSQRKQLRAFAERHGLIVIAESFEAGSGLNWQLQGFRSVLRRAKNGEFRLLVAKDISRVSRDDVRFLIFVEQLRQAGVRVVLADQPFADSPDGRMMRTVTAAAVKLELELTRQRTMDGKREKLAQGKPVANGAVPYGWRKVVDGKGRVCGFEYEPTEAAIIRRIIAEVVDSPLRVIADRLNADGVPTPGSTRHRDRGRSKRRDTWSAGGLISIINNPMVHGEYRYGKVRRVTSDDGRVKSYPSDPNRLAVLQFPPIVAKAEVERAKAALTKRKRKRRARVANQPSDPYILRGLLTCAHCGGALAVDPVRYRGGERIIRYYGCGRAKPSIARRLGMEPCPMRRVPSDGLEQWVRGAVRETMLREDVLRMAIRRTRQLDASGEEYEERLRTIEHMVQQYQNALSRATADYYATESESAREGIEVVKTQLAREANSLRTELAQLKAFTPRGISQREEDAILAAREDIARLMTSPDASPAALRGVVESLRIQGTLGVADQNDPNAIHLGRYAGGFSHSWQGSIAVPRSRQSVASFSNGGADVVGAYTDID
jgi:DNA invertase Pin-like site-specific DNA recombinase